MTRITALEMFLGFMKLLKNLLFMEFQVSSFNLPGVSTWNNSQKAVFSSLVITFFKNRLYFKRALSSGDTNFKWR